MASSPRTTLHAAGLPVNWEVEASMLTDRFMLYELLKVFVWTYVLAALLFTVIFTVQGEPGRILPLLGVVGLGVGVIALLSIFVILLFFRNHYRTRTTISEDGVLQESLSRVARVANRAAVVVGVLTGKPGPAGAGLIAMSRESIMCRWAELHRVKPHPGQRVITLMNSWRVVMRLYCTPDNYDTVLDLVTRGAAAAATARAGRRAS